MSRSPRHLHIRNSNTLVGIDPNYGMKFDIEAIFDITIFKV